MTFQMYFELSPIKNYNWNNDKYTNYMIDRNVSLIEYNATLILLSIIFTFIPIVIIPMFYILKCLFPKENNITTSLDDMKGKTLLR